ncbi:MAG: hypothetical protein MRY79_08280 [Alphaproteobacteria bacterium]|nr:hypothetical protein [Alphaproteobacteria bacterium]
MTKHTNFLKPATIVTALTFTTLSTLGCSGTTEDFKFEKNAESALFMPELVVENVHCSRAGCSRWTSWKGQFKTPLKNNKSCATQDFFWASGKGAKEIKAGTITKVKVGISGYFKKCRIVLDQ